MDENKKYDHNKLRYNLLPVECIEEIIKVFMYGSVKYGDFNWQEKPGFHYSRLYNSLCRHLTNWVKGTDYDTESKELELAHIAANAIMLLYYYKHQIGIDDRKVNSI